MDKPMTILPDLSDLIIEQVSVTDGVTVTVHAASLTALCPCCGTESKRVHSYYIRTLHDLPASGRTVLLTVRVRRFFCQESTCKRKIFAERFPSLTLPRAKFTKRLLEALKEMGFEQGGEAGARLGKKLGYPGSADTILRLVKQDLLPIPSSPRVVGVDDWSWKRGLRYGTLICDLENNTPIDVLADRSVETVSAWFEHHPSVEIASRDRSSEYAAAITKGAPQALQVADVWHIGKNLGDSVHTLLARCRVEIRRGLQLQTKPTQEPEETKPVLQEEKPPPSRSEEQARLARRAQKLDRYDQVVELQKQGVRAADIASRVGIGQRTVHRWLAHGSFPEAKQRRRRPSLIDPYERYVIQRLQQGCQNGLQLYRELAAQGYRGSPKALYAYLAMLRASHPPSELVSLKQQECQRDCVSTVPLENFSARRAAWLFVRQPDKLDETSRQELALIRAASPSAEAAYRLAQAFMQMIWQRTGKPLETWLSLAEESALPELKSFAKGIRQDQAAVFAGLTLPWSNGPVEGHVNRLKLIKRSMYGRAKLRLLRQRVLHTPPKKRKRPTARVA